MALAPATASTRRATALAVTQQVFFETAASSSHTTRLCFSGRCLDPPQIAMALPNDSLNAARHLMSLEHLGETEEEKRRLRVSIDPLNTYRYFHVRTHR